MKWRERAIVSQARIGTVSKATLGKFLRDGVERMWAFPSTWHHLELSWTKLYNFRVCSLRQASCDICRYSVQLVGPAHRLSWMRMTVQELNYISKYQRGTLTLSLLVILHCWCSLLPGTVLVRVQLFETAAFVKLKLSVVRIHTKLELFKRESAQHLVNSWESLCQQHHNYGVSEENWDKVLDDLPCKSTVSTGTVSKATLGKQIRGGAIIMGFSERINNILYWTELNWRPMGRRCVKSINNLINS